VLEVRHSVAVDPRLVTRLAHDLGVTEQELIAEAEELVQRFREAGAVTWEAQVQLVADDCGIPVEDLHEELASMEVLVP
jgi:hypothetical protein